jgi:ParB-like chromosome segregation protein Spo0J
MKLVPTNSVNPSTYNPRKADPRRLDILELSLRKIGWVMPIYADNSGEILSGHQRHHVAQRMGMKYVPVEYVKDMDLAERKAVNIVFNRGTNDLESGDVPKDMTKALEDHNPYSLAETMPDIAESKLYRCTAPDMVDIDVLIKANKGETALAAAEMIGDGEKRAETLTKVWEQRLATDVAIARKEMESSDLPSGLRDYLEEKVEEQEAWQALGQ